MSLFRCKTRWSVVAGNGSEEDQCDYGCLLISSVFSNDDSEVIIIGSHAGILRIFQPHGPRNNASTSAFPSDLMLETQLGYPILHLSSGPFVTGSTEQQLAVLTNRSVSIYQLKIVLSNNELAHACSIQILYERILPDSIGIAWQLITGRFGAGAAAVNTMSFGVMTSDGILAVYEREARQPLLLKLFSSDELPLPGPVAYCAIKDSFIIVTPSWQLHSHKYTSLAQSGLEYRNPDWSVSLGDATIHMEVVSMSSAAGGREPTLSGPEILVLGQRSLSCWQWAGTLRFSRKLPAAPRCMIHHIAEGSLMILVACDTLLLYRDGNLCWTSQPPFPPIIMSTISIEGICGHLVLVSDTLEIQCCILGTEPTLYRAPPAINCEPESVENMRQELQKISDGMKVLQLGSAMAQPELSAQMFIKVTGDICRGTLRLGVVAPVSLVCASITTSPPISASPATISITSLSNSVEIPVSFEAFPGQPPANLDVHVNVSYGKSTDGSPYISKADVAKLPLNVFLNHLTSQPSNQSKSPLRFSFAFKGDAAKIMKFILPGISQVPGSTINLQDGTENIVSIILIPGTIGGMCHVSSISIALASLVISTIITCPLTQPTITTAPDSITWLNIAIDHFYDACRNFKQLQTEVEDNSIWLRQVQLRLLNRFKDRSAQSLNALDVLLFDAFNNIHSSANKLIDAEKDLDICSRELSSVLTLCCNLLSVLETPIENLTDIRGALSADNVHKQWIECVTASLEQNSQGYVSSLSDAQPARLKSLLARTLSKLIQS